MTPAVRTLVVWCPDWGVVAAGVPLDVPGAVLRANRIVSCTPAARDEGVTLHLRRRDAQARCPGLVLVDDDPDRSARAFEPVAQAIERLAPRLEIVHPGCCAVPTRGPSRYHGGDQALAALAGSLVGALVPEVQVGVADGIFAATLAARSTARVDARSDAGARAGGAGVVQVVRPGGSADFLAPLPLRVLDRPDLVDVLRRLGLRTLGDLAALPPAKVAGRFGAEGVVAHRLARGLDERPPATRPPPPDLRVAAEVEPPAERVEAAAFVARGLADDLHRRITARGSACTRLLVGAETEHGERHERLWRTEGTFSPGAIADRLRWQLEGWLQQGAQIDTDAGSFARAPSQHPSRRPTGGICRLWLVPDEVVAAGGRQLSFSAGPIDGVAAAERAGRALARVQGLVGLDAVLVPEWQGGRGPGERVALVAVGTNDLSEPRPAARPEWVVPPWPGAIPPPAPALVHAPPLPAEIRDAEGGLVQVSGRGEISAAPARLRAGRGAAVEAVTAWAGPWPCEERWWDPSQHRRRARLQVVTDQGRAYLLVVEANRWAVEATYD